MNNNEIRLVTLTKDELELLCSKAAEVGAKTALDKLDQERKKIRNKEVDKRLHNTKLLLESYRMLKLHTENSIYGKSQMDESAADILNNMMNLYDDEVIIDSIKRSATRTAIIVSHIEKMLEIYKIYCAKTNKSNEIRKYNIIYDFYIADKNFSIDELIGKYHYSSQTIYNDIKSAESALTALFFGVDSLKIRQ